MAGVRCHEEEEFLFSSPLAHFEISPYFHNYFIGYNLFVEKLIVARLAKKLSTFYGTVHYRFYKSQPLETILRPYPAINA
jgi:hypothetical protein